MRVGEGKEVEEKGNRGWGRGCEVEQRVGEMGEGKDVGCVRS